MSALLTTLLLLSFGLSVAGLVWHYVTEKRWKPVVLGLAGLIVVFAYLHSAFGFPQIIETKDAGPETLMIIVCYFAVLIGMVAQYFFTLMMDEDNEFKLKFVIMPIIASPIVFIPVLSIIQNADLTTALFSSNKLMVYLIAFQNGFFWQDVVRKLRQGVQS